MAKITKRKTIEVERVKELANKFLDLSSNCQTNERIGVAGLLENILHETGNYKGFNYISGKGIIHDERPGGTNHTFLDETRRFYH